MVKKINPKIVTLAILVLSFIAAGGIGIHKAMAPGTGGVDEEFEPTGG